MRQIKKMKTEITESKDSCYSDLFKFASISIGIIGCIAVVAIYFGYTGKIQYSIGSDGASVSIEGAKK